MKNWKLDVALVGAAALAIAWLYDTFARNDRVDNIEVRQAYGQYFDRLDDYQETEAENNPELLKVYGREMERLRALICEHDPNWERCE